MRYDYCYQCGKFSMVWNAAQTATGNETRLEEYLLCEF
jgi:hypothetical protein